MSKLAPTRLAGMVMGTWFLAASIGNYFAGRASQLAARGFGFLFWVLIIASVVIAAALFGVAPKIKRLLESKGPLPVARVAVADDKRVVDDKGVES
jgi:POT family proton-dependent oligopeptide transporter